MANTLYEYYTGLGQALPSIQDRSKIYEQQGLGAAGTYAGTAQQNISLLGKLQAPAPAQAPISPSGVQVPASSVGTQPTSTQGLVDASAQSLIKATDNQASTNFLNQMSQAWNTIQISQQQVAGAMADTPETTAARTQQTQLQQEQQTLQTQLQGMQEKVQERALEGTMLRGGMESEIANIAGGRTRESLVNIREQGLNYQKQLFAAQTLANAQASQSQKLEAAKFMLDANQVGFDNAIKMAQLVAPKSVSFNEATGQIVYSNPMTGETTVQQVAGYIPTPKEPAKATPDIQEYEYAKSQGYKGTFTDYQKQQTTTTPTPSVSRNPVLTTTQEYTLQARGVTPEIYNLITQAILGGSTLEEIRQALRADGLDPKVLDTYDQVVGIAKLLGQEKTTTSGSKLDTILNAL